jgi:hypothetical protein
VPKIALLGRAGVNARFADQRGELVGPVRRQIAALRFSGEPVQHGFVQPRLRHLEIDAADQHRPRHRSELLAAARRDRLDAIDARLVESRGHAVTPLLRTGERRCQRALLAVRRRDLHRHFGVGDRTEVGVAHDHADAIGYAGDGRAHRRDGHRPLRARRDPARQLPPDRLVAVVGSRPHHPPPPRRFAGKHHRTALAVALCGDERLRVAARGQRYGQHLRAGARAANRRYRGERRQLRPFLTVLLGRHRQPCCWMQETIDG